MDKNIAIAIALLGVLMVMKALTGAGMSFGKPRPVAKRFMTARECAMLDILERCLPEYRFHAQVAMGALLKAPPRLFGKNTHADRNAFSQKIVDFVAQDRTTGAIVAIIEHYFGRLEEPGGIVVDSGGMKMLTGTVCDGGER